MSCNALHDEYMLAKDALDVLWRVNRSARCLADAKAIVAQADDGIAKLGDELDACLDKAGVEPGPVTIAARSIYCYSEKGGSNPYIIGGCKDYSGASPVSFDANATLTGPWWQGDAPQTEISSGQELRAINLVPIEKFMPAALVKALFKDFVVEKPFWNPKGEPERIPPRPGRKWPGQEVSLVWLVMNYANDDSLGSVHSNAVAAMNSGFQASFMDFFKSNGLSEPPRQLHVSKLDMRLATLHGSSKVVGNGDYFDVTFVIRRG
jgi:hypothetical protein